jgi:hypothetical protein
VDLKNLKKVEHLGSNLKQIDRQIAAFSPYTLCLCVGGGTSLHLSEQARSSIAVLVKADLDTQRANIVAELKALGVTVGEDAAAYRDQAGEVLGAFVVGSLKDAMFDASRRGIYR